MSQRLTAQRALQLLDLTSLGDADTETDIQALAQNGAHQWGHVAALCVWAEFVPTARAALPDPNIQIATVVNFPAGGTDIAAVVAETKKAIAAGADEIDLVFPYHALIAGDEKIGAEMVSAVKQACGEQKLKVILETGELPSPALQQKASEIALENGADFLKTSTGKTANSASLSACKIMLTAIKQFREKSGRDVGLKPSGGIRTVAEAADYLALADRIMGPDWVSATHFRFGASSLLKDILAVLSGQESNQSAPTGY